MIATSTHNRQLIHRYVADINKYPLLSREAELALAERCRSASGVDAARALVVANLRFVVKIANEYSGYGLTLLDIIQEGNIGLMMAVRKFDASRGYRLISYAVWWIRAYIQSFIIRSWSLVKLGTTQGQRKMFFRLRSERARADRDAGPGEIASATSLAARLRVPERELMEMEMRLAARDFSLGDELSDSGPKTHLDMLVAPGISQEEALGASEMQRLVRQRVGQALKTLDNRESYIVRHRLLTDEPKTLREIGDRFHLSRERVRQIEGNIKRRIKNLLASAN